MTRVENEAAAARRELRRAGQAMARHDLCWGTAGNISLRLGPDAFLLSGSGTDIAELSDEDLVLCTVEGDAPAGPMRPSKELPMHRAVYRARPDAGAVLHSSPFYGTLVACTDMEVPNGLFVESAFYLQRLARVPYFHPGTEALGEAVGAMAAEADVLLLENHGVLVLAADLGRALAALQTLEMACRMAALAAGRFDLRAMTAQQVRELRETVTYRPGQGAAS